MLEELSVLMRYYVGSYAQVRPEDIMLKNLMIILFFQYQQLCFCVLNEYSFFYK